MALAAGAIAAALLVSACSDGTVPPRAAAEVGTAAQASTVSIKDFLFSPTPLRVPPGATITWTNLDRAVHSVVSADKGVFASEAMEQDATFTFTPSSAGTVDYVCGIHNYMRGQIVVA